MNWLVGSLVALAGVVIVAGCGDDADRGAAASGREFENVPWVLASGVDAPGTAQHTPSVTFADGTAAGFAGCNRFSASYTVDGDTLEIGTVATTRMACPGPAEAVEREFLAALDRVGAWRAADGALTLADRDGKALLGFRAASPAGAWVATAFLQGDAVSSPLAGTEVTATFADGTLSGSAGCNTYRATYTTDRGALTIGKLATTNKACTEPDGIAEQEQAYLSALPLAVSYRVEGATLSLLTASGTLVASYTRGP